jgi:hypothetical protein
MFNVSVMFDKFAFQTIVGYNFVKYDALARLKETRQMRGNKIEVDCTCQFCRFNDKFTFQYENRNLLGCFFNLDLIYVAFFKQEKVNARNGLELKSYIVVCAEVELQ